MDLKRRLECRFTYHFAKLSLNYAKQYVNVNVCIYVSINHILLIATYVVIIEFFLHYYNDVENNIYFLPFVL